MKKIVWVFLIFLSFAQARFFVGFDGGVSYNMSQKDTDMLGKGNVIQTKYSLGGYVGVNLGTEHYLARDSLLFRWFVSTGGDFGLGYGDLNLGIDFMGMLYKGEETAFGVFLGVEMSTVFLDWISGFGGALRLGVSTVVSKNHRLELYWRRRLGEFSTSQTTYLGVSAGYETIYTHYRQNDTLIFGYKKLF